MEQRGEQDNEEIVWNKLKVVVANINVDCACSPRFLSVRLTARVSIFAVLPVRHGALPRIL